MCHEGLFPGEIIHPPLQCVCVCVRTLDSQTLKKMPSQWGHLKWSSLFETYKSAYFLLNGNFRFGSQVRVITTMRCAHCSETRLEDSFQNVFILFHILLGPIAHYNGSRL